MYTNSISPIEWNAIKTHSVSLNMATIFKMADKKREALDKHKNA